MFKEKTSNAKASLCLKLLMVLLCSAAFVLSSFGFCGGTAYAETAYTLIDEMNETGYLDDNSIVSSASEDQALNGLRFENVYEPFYATSETITGFAFKLNISGVTQGSLIFTLNTSTENTSAEPARIPSAAAATVIIPYEEISANYNTGKVWVRVAFNTPVTVTPGALYYLGVNADGFNAEATVQNLGQVTSHAGGQNADKIPHVLIQQAKDSTEFVMSPGAGCGFFKIYTKDKNGVTIIDSVTEANYIDDNTIIHSGTTAQALNGLRFENIYQPFTATSGTVTGIAVSLEISGVTQGTLKIGIVEDYLNPAGTEVAGVRIPYNRISAYLAGEWVRVAFNTPATVTAGEQYYIYINCDGFNDTASAVNKGEPAGIGSDTKNRDAISGALQIEKKDDLTLSSTGTYTYFKVYTKDGSGAVIETIAQQDYMNTEVIAAHGNRGGVASGQGFDSATAVVGSKSVKSSFSGEGKDKVIFYREIMADGGLINTNYISKDNLMFSFWIKNTGADNILLKAGSAVLLGEEDSNPDGSYTEGQTKFALNTDYTLLPGWNKVNVDVSAALAGTS